MPFIDDDEVIEALLTDRANPAFCISIRIWMANRCMDDFDALCGKDLIKSRDELRVPLMEQVAKGWRTFFESPTQLARLLRDPGGGWMLGTPCEMDTARA